jgi:hypothetical protein
MLFSTFAAITTSALVIVAFVSAYFNVAHEYGVVLLDVSGSRWSAVESDDVSNIVRSMHRSESLLGMEEDYPAEQQ